MRNKIEELLFKYLLNNRNEKAEFMICELRKALEQLTDKNQRNELGKLLFEKEIGLFEYCDLMKNNPCVEVSICQDGVHATFEINGKLIKMELDQTDFAAVPYTILAGGTYEKEEMDMVLKIMSYMEKDAVVFDVGANLGWYGINIKKRFADFQLHFFEPVPDTYKRLLRNLKLNDIEECYVNNIGLSNATKDEQFYYDVTGSGASSMADLRELETTKKILVRMQRMDEYFTENAIQRVDFIKCDVEGAELLVYQGGLETIQRHKPVVFSEMLRKWSAKFNYYPNDIIDLFGKLGYQCFVIRDGMLKNFDRVDEETLETNYFFLHSEKHFELIKSLVH